MSFARPLSVALYSHDGMGLGHMRRNALIASGLSREPDRASTLLLAGAREMNLLSLPQSVECLTLPGFRKVGNGHYEPRHLDMDTSRLVDLRRRVLLTALDSFAPDVLVVDKAPQGIYGELLPALHRLRKRGTRIVLGLRDILDDPTRVRKEWQEAGDLDVIEALFDAIWVYGDPAVYDLLTECGVDRTLSHRTRFTGYLDPMVRLEYPVEPDTGADDTPDLPAGGRPYILCQVGGGEDGEALATAFLQAEFPEGSDGVLVHGPFLPETARQRLRTLAAERSDVRLIPFLPDTLRMSMGAQRVVSMGGYNSVCEMLASGRPGLVVPRVRPREEQRIRAERMAARGLLDWLHPDHLTPDALSAWMTSPVAMKKKPAQPVDFGGLGRLPGFVRDLMEGSPAGDASGTHSALLPALEVAP